MGALDAVAARVARGQAVEFRPRGHSMVPLIGSGDQVRVEPVDPSAVEVGDIVLARVTGATYLHLVSAVDHARKRVQISNNRGRVNGWTGHARVYGICVSVAGVPRPRIAGKQRAG
ncbi:S24/S26 family peptidase [Actinoplanes flavus]|uniref:S24/S26 family peptidase n=1 Tax=Actinoplanes flavus TaxID=2820290 RepID=A0ABS3UK90_9ACTN|nr:S24/S26 family peptidase [Actinoplanes flavus]MBO3739209.1 S24/S26 family peptidase [Actinoplanes flavus]